MALFKENQGEERPGEFQWLFQFLRLGILALKIAEDQIYIYLVIRTVI